VVVAEVDAAARRIRLSVTAVQMAHEAQEVQDYAERPDSAPSEGFGALADKLRSALKKP
jgi:ribosomal protein S1